MQPTSYEPTCEDWKQACEWLTSQDKGASSQTILRTILGLPALPFPDAPCDNADFGRCYRLLQQFSHWKLLLSLVAAKYPEWRGIVREWDNLTRFYEVIGDSQYSTEFSKRLYELRKETPELELTFTEGLNETNIV